MRTARLSGKLGLGQDDIPSPDPAIVPKTTTMTKVLVCASEILASGANRYGRSMMDRPIRARSQRRSMVGWRWGKDEDKMRDVEKEQRPVYPAPDRRARRAKVHVVSANGSCSRHRSSPPSSVLDNNGASIVVDKAQHVTYYLVCTAVKLASWSVYPTPPGKKIEAAAGPC